VVRDFVRVLGVARRHVMWLVAGVVSMVIVATATVFATNLVRPLYDDLLGGGVVSGIPSAGEMHTQPPMIEVLDRITGAARARIESLSGGRRLALLTLVVVIVAVKNLATFVARLAMARFGLVTIRDLRNLLFDAVLGQSPGFFGATPKGSLYSRMISDVQLVHEALAERLGDVLQDSLVVVAVVGYMMMLDIRLAVATLVVAPLMLAPVVHFSRRLKRRSLETQERMSELATVLDETVTGIPIVQAYGMEHVMSRRFRSSNQLHLLASLRARALRIANGPVMEVVGAVGAVALIAYASGRIAGGDMTLGDFSAFLVGAFSAYNPIKRLNKFNLALQQASVASSRIFEIVDSTRKVRDLPGASDVGDLKGGIELESVGFAYDAERWVLKGFSLTIGHGETVALVGRSGAGKSTVARLILRFWDVLEGEVRVFGRDVRGLRLASLRAHIGLVTQETILFNDTVWENLSCGVDEITRDELVAAAKAAHAHDFVLDLPYGYDTVIGPGGSRLSGGQRQRLAIARAFLRNPEVLILDEATSALDSESEALVQKAMVRLLQGRTALVIAHRLSTVQRADRVAVLSGGRVVEVGSPAELMKSRGEFYEMVRLQELSGFEDQLGDGDL